MNDDVRKQAKNLVEDAAKNDSEMTATVEELKDMEKQMADLTNTILGTNQAQDGFIGSDAESAMMEMARELAKTDPETAVLLKQLEESERQVAGLMGILGAQEAAKKNMSEEEKFARYLLLAEQGDAEAQYRTGLAYEFGEVVERNMDEAAKWYRLAAERGIAGAQFSLGVCYYCGWGVQENPEEAVKWYYRAAKQGDERALNNLADAYEHGYGVEKNIDIALQLYHMAADMGVAVSQHSLGKIYEDGIEIEKNNEEAIKWYKLAAEQGYEDSIERLKNLRKFD